MDHDCAIKSRAAEKYLLGELRGGERDEFEAHFFECAECGEEIRSADLFIESLREVLAEAPQTQRVTAITAKKEPAGGAGWWTWMGALRPAFAYASLAAVLIISGESVWLLQMRRNLAEATAPRMLASAVLRAETRGEAVRVYAPDGGPLLLTFDVVAPQPYSRYRFQINSASDAKVLELTGAAPPPEKPVMLSIPGSRLAAGRYTLTVDGLSAAGGDAARLGQYRFEVLSKEEPAR